MRPEDLAGYICGINTDYEVMVIGVFIKDNSVRLLGPEGSHLVHSSNNFDMHGFKREAEIVWNLTDMFDVARDEINSEAAVEKIAQLKKRASQMKAAAEKKAAKKLK
jgi:hypothetical protein